ncbi:MAG: hypothetical protein M3N39_02645 [Pseudomonadota bacterium]|nr:hypothetical protein [Pseudomonadota bacterium]
MDYRDRLIRWMREERDSLERQIEMFSSGDAQFREKRNGRMVDVTGATLSDLTRRLAELQSFVDEFEARIDA